MKIFAALALCIILLPACSDPPEAHPDAFPPGGRDEVVTRSVQVINYTANTVEVELRLNLLYYYTYGALCDEKAWGDYILNYANDLPNSAFSFEAFNDENYQTVLKSVQEVPSVASNQAFSTLLLIDNTRDFPLTESDDPNFNRRFEALNYFFLNTPKPSNFALAAFGNNGRMGTDVKFAAGFNQDWQTYASEAIKLSEEEGGTNNIIQALDEAIDYVDENATNPEKSIVVITHSYPEFQLSSYITIANKAVAKGITIHIIDLAFFLATDIFGYQELTKRTGGFYASASAHPNSGSYPGFGYGNVMIQLNELLKRQFQEYVVRLEITYTGPDPSYFEPGYIYPHVTRLKYMGDDRTICGTKYFLEEFEENMILYAFAL